MSTRDIARGVAAIAALGAIAYAGFTAGGSGALWAAHVETGAATIQLGAFQYDVTRAPTPQFGRYDEVTTETGTSDIELVKDPDLPHSATHPMQPGDVVVYSYPINVDIPQGTRAELTCDATTGFRSDYETGIPDVPMLATAITVDGSTPATVTAGSGSTATAAFNGPSAAGISVMFTYPNDPEFPFEVLKTPREIVRNPDERNTFPVADHKPLTAAGTSTPVDPIADSIDVTCSLERVS